MKTITFLLSMVAITATAISGNAEKTQCHKTARETQKAAVKDCKAKGKGPERKECIDAANATAKDSHKACDAAPAAATQPVPPT